MVTSTDLGIIHTKLNRPPAPPDLVSRDHLLSFLEQNFHASISLVSAPAGYGKSTLVGHWLEKTSLKSTWVSLDEYDDDLRVFFTYLVAAVQKLFPGSCKDSALLPQVTDFPSTEVVAHQFITDLEDINERFILVLDDYQVIHDSSITDLLGELLRHPLPSLHLVLTTRRDPPLPFPSLRSKGLLTEIRAQDLRFTAVDAASLIEKITGIALGDEEIATLEKKTEGWVAGLRLTALTLRNQPDVIQVLDRLPDDNRYVMEYIVGEVVSQQPPDIQKCLLSLSILDRFCTPLCEAVCDKEGLSAKMVDEQDFLDWLLQSNLFLVQLDTSHTWFRFHHLFRNLLMHQMHKYFGVEEIMELKTRAGRWFAENGHVDEALHFLLQGGSLDTAVELVCSHRHARMNSEHWRRLDAWLNRLPPEVIDTNAELLIAKAWNFDSGLQVSKLKKYVEKAGRIIAEVEPGNKPLMKSIMAEYHALTGFLHYLNSDGEQAIQYSRMALDEIDQSAYSVRGYSSIILAGSYQMAGELDKAYAVVYDAFENDITYGTTYHSRLFVALCFVHWIAGDMGGLLQAARELLKIGNDSNLPESISFGHYFLGMAHYYANELDKARTEFQQIFGKPYYTNIWDYSHSAFGLALVEMSAGHPDQALQMVDKIISLAYEKKNNDLLKLAKAFQADIALQGGNVSASVHWSATYEPRPFRPGYRSYMPQLTFVKALLAESSLDSLKRATLLLQELNEYFQSIHNNKFLVEVILLQSLVYAREDDEQRALAALNDAIVLAEPGRLVRSFLDLGSPMTNLLQIQQGKGSQAAFVQELLSGFADAELVKEAGSPGGIGVGISPGPGDTLDDPLTKREIELLEYLAGGMSNKDIADKLFISPETVKTHLSNMYRKLEVKNRRQAVLKGSSFGII